jgi:hypothetical protein
VVAKGNLVVPMRVPMMVMFVLAGMAMVVVRIMLGMVVVVVRAQR